VASKQKQASGSGPNGRLTKNERRDLARRQRDEMRRKAERARRNRRLTSAAIIAAVIIGGVWIASARESNEPNPTAGPLPGMMTDTAPWPNNTADMTERLQQLSLPAAGGALHVHSHLSLFVDGEQIPVPADIGIDGNTHSPLHSHDGTGVIHIESADAGSTFTLGEYLDVWGLRLTSSCLGGYCDQGQKSLHVFVDGEPYSGDPRQIELADQQEITIAYGTDDQVPDPLPTYNWDELVA
jgi:hypothetical protein